MQNFQALHKAYQETELLSENEEKCLFPSAVTTITGLSKMFLDELESFWNGFDNELSKLSEIMKHYSNALRVHSFYTQGYDQANQLRQELTRTKIGFADVKLSNGVSFEK
eukprot:UN08954